MPVGRNCQRRPLHLPTPASPLPENVQELRKLEEMLNKPTSPAAQATDKEIPECAGPFVDIMDCPKCRGDYLEFVSRKPARSGCGAGREGRGVMYANMTLAKLIAWLEQQDPDLMVSDGFGSPHSDRGSYKELAFTPEPKALLGDMLEYARSAMGAEFTGWKGGTYLMDKDTSVYIGECGECGEEITSVHFKYWLLTGRKNAGEPAKGGA